MRVTHVITRLIVGGAQENTIASVLGLREKPGMDVRLISGADTGPEGSLASAFDRIPSALTFVPELVRPVHPVKDLQALGKLAKIFREQRPDIVHTHSGKAGVLGRLAAHRAGVPVIIHTIHGPSFGAFQSALANLIFLEAERRAGKITTHFVTVADAMTRQYLAAGIGRPEQYTKIFSGFPLSPFLSADNDPKLRARYGLTPKNIVIGKIARLFKLKGHDDLFRIAPELVRAHPQVRFLLVGDGSWRMHFEQQARALGLEKHFIFTGLVPPAEVPRLVGIMDIVVHLSLREGLARALPQALAAGKPIVAYDCDGAREVCRDNETGFLVRPGDLTTLRERLGRLVADAALREKFGRCGQEFVREHFPVEKMVDDLFALYLKLSPARK
ncbi:MAG TPA: glycosyltransferase family 4 protein [Verrucomicrobiae bacterium]|jgi:glycosyltransferase involved in cell wall biosynthesis|nr:glycosyltransferase family 4 protein [Verrucomicrobiae bacterium]